MISVRFEATNLWLLADKKLKGQDPEQVEEFLHLRLLHILWD